MRCIVDMLCFACWLASWLVGSVVECVFVVVFMLLLVVGWFFGCLFSGCWGHCHLFRVKENMHNQKSNQKFHRTSTLNPSTPIENPLKPFTKTKKQTCKTKTLPSHPTQKKKRQTKKKTYTPPQKKNKKHTKTKTKQKPTHPPLTSQTASEASPRSRSRRWSARPRSLPTRTRRCRGEGRGGGKVTFFGVLRVFLGLFGFLGFWVFVFFWVFGVGGRWRGGEKKPHVFLGLFKGKKISVFFFFLK